MTLGHTDNDAAQAEGTTLKSIQCIPCGLDYKIRAVLDMLTWPIVNTQHDLPLLQVLSSPWHKIHNIRVPHNLEISEYEYLHELAHAFLAERHHLLATAYFAAGTVREDFEILGPAVRIAPEWLAWSLIAEWCPIHFNGILLQVIDPDDQYCLSKGCEDEPLAEPMWYALRSRMGRLYQGRDIPAHCRKAVAVFLAAELAGSSAATMRDLINGLAALHCDLRVEEIEENGFGVWRITKNRKPEKKQTHRREKNGKHAY